MASHLSVHPTTFPLMPAPRTLLPTKKSSSKGVVLTTRGGLGLGKFGPLLPILEEEKEANQVTGPWSVALGVFGGWEYQVVRRNTQLGGFLCCKPVQPYSSKSLALLYTVYSTTHLRMADQVTIWDYHTFHTPHKLPRSLIR